MTILVKYPLNSPSLKTDLQESNRNIQQLKLKRENKTLTRKSLNYMSGKRPYLKRNLELITKMNN